MNGGNTITTTTSYSTVEDMLDIVFYIIDDCHPAHDSHPVPRSRHSRVISIQSAPFELDRCPLVEDRERRHTPQPLQAQLLLQEHDWAPVQEQFDPQSQAMLCVCMYVCMYVWLAVGDK